MSEKSDEILREVDRRREVARLKEIAKYGPLPADDPVIVAQDCAAFALAFRAEVARLRAHRLDLRILNGGHIQDLRRAEARLALLEEYHEASELFWTGTVDDKLIAVRRLHKARAALAAEEQGTAHGRHIPPSTSESVSSAVLAAEETKEATDD